MLRRIGFRHLLPPLQLVLYCVLCYFGYLAQQTQKPCTYYWISSGSFVLAQDGETFTFLPPCRAPKAWLAAGSLNLPAYLAGVILAAIFTAIFNSVSEAWTFAISAPMVVVLWYWVGLWIDRRMGYVGSRTGRFRFPPILATVAAGFSIVIVFLSAIMMLRAAFHQGHRVEDIVVASSFASWSVFLLVVASSIPHRPHPPVSGMRG